MTLNDMERRLWKDAFSYDAIPEDSKHFVFSDDNPYVPFLQSVRYEQVRRYVRNAKPIDEL
jgi:hypothetical protein